METINNYRVLLVEDDQMLIKMYVTKLEKEGFIIDVAHNGKEGLEKLKEKQYDTVLLDLMMPEMDGFEMLRVYNNSSEYKKAPILILSNLGQKEDINQAIALGIGEDNYIVKANMTPTEVINKIRTTIARFTKAKE